MANIAGALRQDLYGARMKDFNRIDVPHGYAVYKRPYRLIGVGETLKEARADWGKQKRHRDSKRTCEIMREVKRRKDSERRAQSRPNRTDP